MLPFLNDKKKQDGGSAVSHINSDGRILPGESPDMGLMSAAEDLINAVNSGNAQRVASALKAAFMICDAEPHHEGPHED